MMEDTTTTPHPDYVTGFNEGYVLSKYMPELSAEISAVLPPSERSSGFKDGKATVESELAKEKYPKFLQKDRSKPDKSNSPTNPTKDRDKGLETNRS